MELDLLGRLPAGWRDAMKPYLDPEVVAGLGRFVAAEYAALWGKPAQQKAPLVTGAPHVVLTAGHPSPANARGFRGSRPFSAVNAALAAAGQPAVRWV